MCSYFPEINNAITKRNKKLLDYDAARSKARKLSDKPSTDASKLPMAEQEADQAEEIYKVIDEQLRNDLPQILDLRVPYLDPSFECMVSLANFLSLLLGPVNLVLMLLHAPRKHSRDFPN